MNIDICLKRVRLRRLARLRCSCQWPGYKQPEHFGYHFEDLVSPYTRSAGNLRADYMLVLQDWASSDALKRMGYNDDVAEFGHNPKLRTNIKLKALLAAHSNLKLEDTYATNLFPFIKKGSISASIPLADIQKAACMFTLVEIRIVKPRYVIALGKKTAEVIRSVVANTFNLHELPHPAARISNEEMDQQWRQLFGVLKAD
jgi:hypothetical protein